MPSFLSSILSFAGGIPWAKIGLWAAIAGGLVSIVYGIKAYGEQTQIISQLKADAKVQHEQDQKTINDLQAQYQRDMEAVQKEKADAIKIATGTQQQLDHIRSKSPSDDGPTRPVLLDTLSWMRGNHSGGNNTDPAHTSTH